MTRQTIDNLARALAESVPEGLRAVREDLEKNFRSVLQAGLGRLDLVTREEFDVQLAVLQRTRAKLADLEARLAQLETKPPAAAKTAARKSVKKPAKKSAKKTAGKKAAKKKR